MQKWTVRVGAVLLVVIVAVSAVGIAGAQGPDNPRGPRQGWSQNWQQGAMFQAMRQNGFVPEILQALEDATGLTRQDVVPLLRDGQTFNEILAANDIDPQVVIDVVTGVITEELDQAVADGRITEERKAEILANLPDRLDTLMNTTLSDGPIRDRIHARLDTTLIGVLAEMAGVEVGDVARDAFTPPSLAEIAAEHGLDPDAIIAETEQRVTDEVNAAVADGSLSQDEADAILDGLHDRLVERFNAPFRPFMWARMDGFGGMMGQRGGFAGGMMDGRGGFFGGMMGGRGGRMN